MVDTERYMTKKAYSEMLKRANKLCSDGDILGSVKLCKSVIKKDPTNYLALVTYGKCALKSRDHKHEAVKAFQAAIKMQKTRVEAFYGLTKYFEGESNYADLVWPYSYLIYREKKEGKWMKILKKVEKLNKLYPDLDLYEVLGPGLNCRFSKRRKIISKIISETAMKNKSIPSKHASVIVKAYAIHMKTLDFYDKPETCKKMLEILANCQHYSVIRSFFEYLVKYERALLRKTFVGEIVAALHHSNPCPDVTEIINYIYPYCKKFFKNAQKRSNVDQVNTTYNFGRGHYLKVKKQLGDGAGALTLPRAKFGDLIRCLSHFLDFDMILSQLQKFYITTGQIDNRFLLTILKLWSRSNTQKCSELCCIVGEQLFGQSEDSLEILLCITYACIALRHFQEAISLLRILYLNDFHVSELNMLYAMTKPITSAFGILRLLPESAFSLMYLASLKAKIGFHEEAVCMIQRALLEDKHNFMAYDLLTEKYLEEGKEIALLYCVLPSYKLNPHRWELVDKLTDLDSDENSVCLLESFRADIDLRNSQIAVLGSFKAGKIRNSKQEEDYDSYYKAAENFRFCMEEDPCNSSYIIALTKSLQTLSFYKSARRTYEIMSIQKKSLFPFIMMARMAKKKQVYGDYYEESNNIVHIATSKSVLALEALADSCLCLAIMCFRVEKYSSARKLCQKSISVSLRALRLNPKLPCLWKILGDALYYCGILPGPFNLSYVPEWLISEEHSRKKVRVNNILALKLALKCYLTGLNLVKTEVMTKMFWHDIALIMLKLSNMCELYLKRKLMKIAFFALKEGIALATDRWQFWNLLGILRASRGQSHYDLSVNAFQKACDLEMNNPVCFGNLSLACWNIGDENVFQEVLLNTRMINPEYGVPWTIGGLSVCSKVADSGERRDTFLMSELVKISKRKLTCFKRPIVQCHQAIVSSKVKAIRRKYFSKLPYGDFDTKSIDLLIYAEVLETVRHEIEYAGSIYLKALSNSFFCLKSYPNIFKSCIYHNARLCSYAMLPLISCLFSAVESNTMRWKFQWVFIQIKRGDIAAAYNEILNILRISETSKSIKKSIYYYLSAVYNLTGNWREARKVYLKICSPKWTRLIIAYKYSTDNKDIKLLQLINESINILAKYNERMEHVPYILRAYGYAYSSDYLRTIQELLAIPNNFISVNCDCKSEILWTLFYAYLMWKDYATAFYWLNQLMKCRWASGNLKGEFLLGCFLAVQMVDPKFCFKAVHIYPHEENLWLLTILCMSKEVKTRKTLRFLKKFKSLVPRP